ncbi:Fic family protein [Staphylococcus pettenkoferi]|uniref:protein adenylyltransferase n=1 Tax=Staphylococcus pettenkoferi TaxID=170573 RepID=A0ABT4BHN0_9STAP|nr:Fic family protein [Staphylococcus pettenkoferi]MCY1563612.1 Fic family protein [Staphylococcus pettenkoferi]MCY1571085.1 Fic family protein [Staphylococcus pettenkoferi]MCY1582184.1 Fic family protein [Staphylococcus pettenkoferi]MCY1606443.1 Fic family protein [Staphylococcus pettenkoferi]MDH9616662.1 Fic family protein [Staphylococcus pettenkoferi]
MKYKATFQDEFLIASNLLGAETIDELEQLEKVAFYISEGLMEEKGYDFLFPLTVSSIKLLHKRLFKRIYSFAGEFRNVSLMKETTRFCEPQYININLNKLIEEFKLENEWFDTKIAAEKLAYYKIELNMIHPFREGNGRTIRLIIREIAKLKGYEWRTDLLNRENYIDAMKKSSWNEKPLIKMFEDTIFSLN